MNYLVSDGVRLTVYFVVFALLAAFEFTRPRRTPSQPRVGRWFSNGSLFFINFFLVRFVLGGAALAAAEFAAERQWGFLNDVSLYWPVKFAIGFLVLDLMLYLQHVLWHALPFLWRFHLVHHSDLDFDVTTAMRVHPAEALIRVFITIGVVVATGIDPWTVLIFETVIAASTQFNHSNIKLTPLIDERLRKGIITPDFHRVHHSPEPEETNSNFGFFLSWWDKLFGTYRESPMTPHNLMQIGLNEYRSADELSLPSLIALPLSARLGAYSFKKEE
jgi:sterol desaturase/sphingolipid hydroxylase (fatty acid hydroxylase superfamily)